MSEQRSIKFYFDYISHNAYIAWTQLPALAKKYGYEIEIIPVLFAGLLQANNQLGPAEVPPKLRWMLTNTLRKAALLNIPLNPPASHPFNPLLALRASSMDMTAAQKSALVDALFRAVWVNGKSPTNTAVISAAADDAGLVGSKIIAEAASDETKARVKKQTDDAIASGVFGVPSMVIGQEIFWGYDDFPYLELFLAGKDPLPQDWRATWTGIKPSATRRNRPSVKPG